MYRLNLIFFAFFLLSVNLNAQIITDRPDQTESSFSIEKGKLQIESGLMMESVESLNGNVENSYSLPTTLFRLGVFNNTELRFGVDLNKTEIDSLGKIVYSSKEISDFEIGFKYQITNGTVQTAFMAHAGLPVSVNTRKTNDVYYITKFALSHSVTENIGFGYNIGYDYFNTGKGELTYSYAIGIGISEKIGVFTEIYGQFFDLDVFMMNYDNGITYLLKDNIQFDFSVGTGLIESNFVFYSSGVSILL